LRRKLFLSSILVFVLLVFGFVVSVEASSAGWSRTYGGEDVDSAESVIQTSDGGYAIVGRTESFGADLSSFWLVKTDKFGNMEWRRAYGGKSEVAYHLVETDGGGYAIVGQTQAFGAGFVDIWFVKTDAYGNMEWNKTYGGTDGDSGRSLLVTSDGGYVIAGHTVSFGAGNSDFWLIKTDEFGNMEWNRTYGDGAARALVETSDGGFALAGGALLVKTDAYGNMEWNQTYDGSIRYLVATPDGGYAIAGTKNDDFWLVKTDEYGNMEWSQTYGGEGDDYANSLVETSDGGFAIAGTRDLVISYLLTREEGNFLLVKTDAYGNMEWNRTYGGAGYDYANSLVETSDGGYAIAGETGSFGAGNYDAWLVKTDEYGIIPEWYPPYICVGSPQNITYTTDNISLNFTVNEETSWMGYSLDGQGNVTIAENTLTLTELADGSHNITVYANDTDGNTGASETISFTVDNAPPVVSVLAPENKTYYAAEIPLNFTVNEETSKITYCLDGQENVTISGNTTLTDLPYGLHSITVYANDTDGNTGTSETISFTIAKENETATTWTTTTIAIAAVATAGAALLIIYTKTKKKQNKK